MRKTLNAAADFETTTDPEDCRVWAWGFSYVDYPDTVEIDGDIESFFERIGEENLRIYFHNLRFDGTFILDWLMKNDYERAVDKLYIGTFTTIISKLGQFYSIKVKLWNERTIEFRDSYKKIPFPVAEVAKVYGMEMEKGEIDYHAPRPPGHVPTREERKYIHNDVSIMAHALKHTLDEGLTRLTTGSDALAEYKSIVGPRFDKWFPVLSAEVDADIRAAYRGGFTYADPRYSKRRIQAHGRVYDVNSLYPYVMYDKLIPYSEPRYHDSHPEVTTARPLTIFQVTFTAKLKPDHIPCIQLKNNFRYSGTEYQTEITEPVSMTVTNIDWDLYNDHYDIDVIEYGAGYSFKASKGMFRQYINKWSEVKANSVGGARALAKLFLNSLYGKFATNPDVTGKYPTLEDGRVKLVLGEPETRDPVYTAAGVFITAYARAHTIRAAQDNYGAFAYADTDSLHLISDEPPTGLEVHPSNIGAWALEYEFSEAMFMRAKGYAELKTTGKLEVHIAGVPKKIADSLTFDDLYDGKILKGKLVPRNVPGGVVLAEVDYRLSI